MVFEFVLQPPRSSFLILPLEDILKFRLVLGLAAVARLIAQNTNWLRLAHAFAGVGLDGLRGRESSGLSFRHVCRWLRHEYE